MQTFKQSILIPSCEATKHEKCQGGGEYFYKALYKATYPAAHFHYAISVWANCCSGGGCNCKTPSKVKRTKKKMKDQQCSLLCVFYPIKGIFWIFHLIFKGISIS